MATVTTRGWKIICAGLLLAGISSPVNAQMVVPKDAKETCVVDPTTFDSWFTRGSPTANGMVNPASSVSFTVDNSQNDGPNLCNFYQWGAQMFLWLTSPTKTGQPVFDSPDFYNVSPASNNKRVLIPNTDADRNFALRSTKPEAIGEVGQAGGDSGVLISQQGSLVYYGIHVNDVYAYFLTGQKNNKLLNNPTTFPRNQDDLAAIEDYVKTAFPQTALNNPQTLAIELKTSWVDAKTVGNKDRYVTILASVPTYEKTAKIWKATGKQEVIELALVGMHVVGTVQDHPEFIWATFEHVSNAPNAAYFYTNADGQLTRHEYDASSNGFLFTAKGIPQYKANVECMHVDNEDIVPSEMKCGGEIKPSDTVRKYPWGSPADSIYAEIVENNTLLISINNSVSAQLSKGDVRGNYVQIGGLWTTTPPDNTDAPIPNQHGNQKAMQRGSFSLSNATMETYQQGTNCFDCHLLDNNAKNSFEPFGLSHIYSEIQPVSVSKCTIADGSLQFLKGVNCVEAQAVATASPPCGNQNYQPFFVSNALGTWETQDQCGGGQQPYKAENNSGNFMWYSCSRYPGDC